MTDVLPAIVPTAHAINCSTPSPVGFVLSPLVVEGFTHVTPRKLSPHMFGAVPGIDNFHGECNIVGNGYLAKKRDQRDVFVPQELADFAPAIQFGINYENLVLGEETFNRRWLAVRISRHTSANGHPHQAGNGEWHNHSQYGAGSFQVTCTVDPTQFKNRLATQARMFIRFEDTDDHLSPHSIHHRAFVALQYTEKDPDPYGECRLHLNLRKRFDATDFTRMDEYRAAGRNILAGIYPEHAQMEDMRRWHAQLNS